MPHEPFNSRWMPLPIQARLDLLRERRYAALIVWETLLCDALRNGAWRTSLPASAVRRETRLSHPTIRKAQRDLLDAGYIRIISGGGGTRKRITFGLTPIENFGGGPAATAPPDRQETKPTGDWKL